MTVAVQRMFGILERWNNNQVAPSISKPHEISYRSNSIKRCRDRLIGHTFRHEGLAETIVKGTIEGRKRQRRQRLEYVKQIIDDVGWSGYKKTRSG